MNEHPTLVNSPTFKISKKHLTLLLEIFPDQLWLLGALTEISAYSGENVSFFTIIYHEEKFKVVAHDRIIELCSLSSAEKNTQFLMLIQNIPEIEEYPDFRNKPDQAPIVFCSHLMQYVLGQYWKYGISDGVFQSALKSLCALLTPIPSSLSQHQHEVLKKKIDSLKFLKGDQINSNRIIQLIFLVVASDVLKQPSEEKIGIFDLLYTLFLTPSNDLGEKFNLFYEEAFELFNGQMSEALEYNDFNQCTDAVCQKIANLVLSDSDVLNSLKIPKFNIVIEILGKIPEDILKNLFMNDQEIVSWIRDLYQWYIKCKSLQFGFSFFYQEHILVLFARNQNQNFDIVSFMPNRAINKKILDFFVSLKETPLYYNVLNLLAKVELNNLSESFWNVAQEIFSGELKNYSLEEGFQYLLHYLNTYLNKNPKKTPSLLESISLSVSKPSLEYFLRFLSLVTENERYELLQDRIQSVKTIMARFINRGGQIGVIFSNNNGKIFELVGHGFPGIKSLLLACIELDKMNAEALPIYWKILILHKSLFMEIFEVHKKNIKEVLGGTLDKEELCKIVFEIFTHWNEEKEKILECYLCSLMKMDNIAFLDLVFFEKLNDKEKLNKLYEHILKVQNQEIIVDFRKMQVKDLVSKASSVVPTKKSSQNNSTFFSNVPKANFQYKIQISKNHLELICCILQCKEIGWKLLLTSLYKGSYPILINELNICIDHVESDQLMLSCADEERIPYIKMLCKIFQLENTGFLLGRTLDMLLISNLFINPAEIEIVKINKFIQQLIERPEKIDLNEIKELEELSQQLHAQLRKSILERWQIFRGTEEAIQDFFTFLIHCKRKPSNLQPKKHILSLSIKKFSIILDIFIQLGFWNKLRKFFEQLTGLIQEPVACVQLNSLLTIWDAESVGEVLVLELKDVSKRPNSLDAQYVEFCEQIVDLVEHSHDFLKELLEIHEHPSLSEHEKRESYLLVFQKKEQKDSLSNIVLELEDECCIKNVGLN